MALDSINSRQGQVNQVACISHDRIERRFEPNQPTNRYGRRWWRRISLSRCCPRLTLLLDSSLCKNHLALHVSISPAVEIYLYSQITVDTFLLVSLYFQRDCRFLGWFETAATFEGMNVLCESVIQAEFSFIRFMVNYREGGHRKALTG